MRPYGTFHDREDYQVPLLELLAEMSGRGGRAQAVLETFEKRYLRFIPAEHYQPLTGTRGMRWELAVRYARQSLARLRFVEDSLDVWRITQEGLQWLQDHPEETHLAPAPPAVVQRAESRTDSQGSADVRPYQTFDVERDYWVPLLELLASLPESLGKPAAAMSEFGGRYGQYLSPKEREIVPSVKMPRWRVKVNWSRYHLAEQGLLANERGAWRITEDGLRWLQENPQATHLDIGASLRRRQRRGRAAAQAQTGASGQPMLGSMEFQFQVRGESFALSRSQVLEAARGLIASGLPAEAQRFQSWAIVVDDQQIGLRWFFEQLTDLDNVNTYQARSILSRLGINAVQVTNKGARRPRRATVSRGARVDEEPEWLEAVRGEVDTIHAFLQGRAERPADDRLCDMVQFCYTLGLHREGWELFALVDKTRCNEWQYERTRKLATICELKGKR